MTLPRELTESARPVRQTRPCAPCGGSPPLAGRGTSHPDRRAPAKAGAAGLILWFGIASVTLAWESAASGSGVSGAALAEGFTNEQLGTWVLILFAIGSGIGGVAGLVALFRPQPALHKQFADKEDTDKKLDEIKEVLAAMRREFEAWSSEHYAARRRLHRKIGHLSGALNYLAGSMSHTAPQVAERLREIVRQADDEADDE